MGVVAHDCPREEPDGEAVCERDQAVFDPGAPVVEVSSREWVVAAKPGATNAGANAVIEARLLWIDDERARIAHSQMMLLHEASGPWLGSRWCGGNYRQHWSQSACFFLRLATCLVWRYKKRNVARPVGLAEC